MNCTEITPVSAFLSTNLNSKIESFNRLGQRISRALGAPLINVEIHSDQLYENISIACELFSKYAGYTEEFLVFDSDIYKDNIGIKLDDLFSITPSFNRKNIVDTPSFVCNTPIAGSAFASSTTLSSTYTYGISVNDIINQSSFSSITAFNSGLASRFDSSLIKNNNYTNSFDYDIMDYRKVISVYDFEEGSTTGVNTLFTIEQTLAQQTYFSYAMGNYGFDLLSWYVLKIWLKDREKLLAQRRAISFDPRTQMLVMYPPPRTPNRGSLSRFYGIISCHVERPLKDLIKEPWVYQYALALTKINVGTVRGKYGNVSLLGGGTLNFNDLLSQGLEEKRLLEEKLMDNSSPGFGDAEPPMFFVG